MKRKSAEFQSIVNELEAKNKANPLISKLAQKSFEITQKTDDLEAKYKSNICLAGTYSLEGSSSCSAMACPASQQLNIQTKPKFLYFD